MFQIKIDCPHCRNRANVVISNLFEYRKKDSGALLGTRNPPARIIKATELDRILCYGCGTCPECDQPVLFIFDVSERDFIGMQHTARDSMRALGHLVRDKLNLISTFPALPASTVHQEYPEKVRQLFPELCDAVARNGNPALIVTGCRSIMEVACTRLGGSGKNLYEKIDDLLKRGILTQSLADWAHRLRLDGNAAVHEIEATPEQAAELVEFIKLFLEVTFVLPTRIAEKRQSD